MKKTRKKRIIVIWQTKDQGADPLTPRGRKWIDKEIAKCNPKELRKQLESQKFEEVYKETDYWKWIERNGFCDEYGNPVEPTQANPDSLSDEEQYE